MSISSARTSFIVSLWMSAPATVSCLADTSQPKSVEKVIYSGTAVTSTKNSVDISLSELFPDTSYTVYCVVVDAVSGKTTSYSDIIATSKQARTSCCKRINANLRINRFPSGMTSENVIDFSLDSPPIIDLVINVSTRILNRDPSVAPELFPNFVILTSTSWSISSKVSLLNPEVGDYQLDVQFSDRNQQTQTRYEVNYPFFRNFTIYSSVTAPPVPKLISSRFQNDGRAILISFDSPTNKLSQDREFNCSLFVRFHRATNSLCLFTDFATLKIYPSSDSQVAVGSPINFVENSLRAMCTSTTAECLAWNAFPSTPFFVSSPELFIPPVIKIRAPQSINECDKPLFDFTSSQGLGGRSWFSFDVSMISADDPSSDAISNILNFFQTQYDVNLPPASCPSGLFRAGYRYTLRFSLCNFLAACGSVTHTLQVSSSPIPSLILLNEKQISILASSSLTLGVLAYTPQCDGSKQYSDLEYRWSVYVDGSFDPTIMSLAKGPTKFLLGPNKLIGGSLCEIKILVTHKKTSQSISDSFIVSVNPSPLVALITGPTRTSVKLGGSKVLNASRSYDPDHLSSKSHLSISWKCSRKSPTLSSFCGLDLKYGSFGIVTVTPKSQATVGDQYSLTMLMSDSSRQNSATVLVDIILPDNPEISIVTDSSSSRWNPSSDLVLRGRVTATDSGVAQWSINDPSIILNGINRTALSKVIVPGINRLNFVLKAGSLPISESPYLISLGVVGYSLQPSIQITMNIPPRPGLLQVSPTIGLALATEFNYFAMQWNDTDLPLTYQFSYSSGGVSQVVQSRSELSYVTTFLPTGVLRENGFVSCEVFVYDSLDAHSHTALPVLVRTNFSSSVLGDAISLRLSEVEGNLESTRQVLAVSGSLLNLKNCSGAPLCSSLNREDCLSSDHMCGPCLPNTIGSLGDGNSLCIPIESYSVDESEKCSTDGDCQSLWQYCSEELSCLPRPKRCDNNCSNHGTCRYQNLDSSQPIETCFSNDLLCVAVCSCDPGWQGEICAQTNEERESRSLATTQLLTSLRGIIDSDEITSENVQSWTSSLSLLSQTKDEISSDASKLIADISSIILSSATSATVLVELLNSLDAIVSWTSTSRRLDVGILTSQELLGETISTLTETMVTGEVPYELSHSSFRASSQRITSQGEDEFSFSLFQSDAEQALHVPQTFCTLTLPNTDPNISIDHGLSLISTKSRNYENSNITSNPMSIHLTNSPVNSSVLCYLPNNIPQNYLDMESSEIFAVNCTDGDYETYSTQCFGGSRGNLTISLTCNGTLSTISQRCPYVQSFPECISDDLNIVCSKVYHNSTYTVCLCSTGGHVENRFLSSSASDFALQVSRLPPPPLPL
jgi:hypothetical protein